MEESGRLIYFIFETMKQLTTTIIFIASVVLIASCKKSGSGSKDTTPPVITFIAPAANGFYAAGDTVTVRGTITDDNVSTASIEIRNKTTNAVLYQQTSTAGNVSFYNFLWKWKNTVSAITPASVKVVATDASGNQTNLEINITLDH